MSEFLKPTDKEVIGLAHDFHGKVKELLNLGYYFEHPPSNGFSNGFGYTSDNPHISQIPVPESPDRNHLNYRELWSVEVVTIDPTGGECLIPYLYPLHLGRVTLNTAGIARDPTAEHLRTVENRVGVAIANSPHAKNKALLDEHTISTTQTMTPVDRATGTATQVNTTEHRDNGDVIPDVDALAARYQLMLEMIQEGIEKNEGTRLQ